MAFANHPIEAVPKMIQRGSLSANNPVLAFISFLLAGESPHGDMPWGDFVDMIEERHFKEIIALQKEVQQSDSPHGYMIALANKICAVGADVEGELRADILLRFGITANAKEEDKDALEALLSARAIYREIEKDEEVAVCDLAIAHVCLASDRPTEAIPYAEQAREYWKHSGGSDILAASYRLEAQAHSKRGCELKAFETYRAGTRLLLERGFSSQAMPLARNAVRAALRLHTPYNAQDAATFESWKLAFEKEPSRLDLGFFYDDLARWYSVQGFLSEAAHLFQSACLIFGREARYNKVAECYKEMADLHRELGDGEKAKHYSEKCEQSLKAFQQQIKYLSEIDRSPEQDRLLQEMVRGNQALNPFMVSLQRYLFQSDESSEARKDLLLFDPGFSGIVFDLHYDFIDIYLNLKDFEGALEQIELLKNQTLTNMLQEKFQTSPPQKKAVHALLPENTFNLKYRDIEAALEHETLPAALVYLFPMEDKTVVFIVRQGTKLSDHTIIINDYTYDHLMADVNDISRGDGSKEDVGESLEAILPALHSMIFEAICPHLDGVEKIIFVPYSGFHLVPLHALFTEENGVRQYVMDRYHVTYAPSARVLRHCWERNHLSGKPKAFVALANPRNDLTFAEDEAMAVRALLDADCLSKAWAKGIVYGARNANIFHYAGHADGNALLLHGESGGDVQKYVTEDIFLSLDLRQASLATLSACKTGRVRLGKTDEYIGLPSAFLHAGAATVICSLWKVADISTTLLMGKMYTLLIKDRTKKADALREAQLWLKDPENKTEHEHMLEELVDWIGDGRRQHPAKIILPEDLHKPYYWAGFICTGAP